jgi:hypothetical protein
MFDQALQGYDPSFFPALARLQQRKHCVHGLTRSPWNSRGSVIRKKRRDLTDPAIKIFGLEGCIVVGGKASEPLFKCRNLSLELLQVAS